MSTAPTLVGVDPGGRHTGVVVRRGSDLLAHLTLTRVGAGELPDRAYLRQVARTVIDLCDAHQAAGVAVEAVQKPSPFVGKTGQVKFSNVNGILGTAMVFGAVVALTPAVVVPPGRNGRAPLATYPPELHPTRGKGAGKDSKRHMRSAWDVAGVGELLLRRQLLSA